MSYVKSILFTDENGNVFGNKRADNKLRVSANSYLYDIAEGLVPNHYPVTITGISSGIANYEVTVSQISTTFSYYVFPPSASAMRIKSSAANDSAAGTGARSLKLKYLDNLYNPQTEIIVPNGGSYVSTVATNILRIMSFEVLTAANTQAYGNITIDTATSNGPYAMILGGSNNCLLGVYTVRAGYTLFLTGWSVSVASAAAGHYGRVELKANADSTGTFIPGYIFYTKAIALMQDNGAYFDFKSPIKLKEKTDIYITCISDVANAGVTCAVTIYGWEELE